MADSNQWCLNQRGYSVMAYIILYGYQYCRSQYYSASNDTKYSYCDNINRRNNIVEASNLTENIMWLA